MSRRRKLWDLFYLPVVALLAAGVLAVVLLTTRQVLR
jgi:hypothetical protein